jgi:hypothetical protein
MLLILSFMFFSSTKSENKRAKMIPVETVPGIRGGGRRESKWRW